MNYYVTKLGQKLVRASKDVAMNENDSLTFHQLIDLIRDKKVTDETLLDYPNIIRAIIRNVDVGIELFNTIVASDFPYNLEDQKDFKALMDSFNDYLENELN